MRGSSWRLKSSLHLLVPERGDCDFVDELPERERGSFQASAAPEYI